ncbi:MAG: four helix bundle protein [Desulfuromonadaceae bacterium]|nr:four helix bundle protein [Desulfuromonadaceae bacterium]MDD5106935.1 four helix bundle protein [Desulfuromonadaceae bacterium]
MKISFTYHKLQVWYLAKDLVIEVYRITGCFPVEEKFGLVSQLNRAAVSVASNIAEGSGRTSRKDQAHFTQLAYGSLMEVACQIEIACDLGFMDENEYLQIARKIDTLSGKLSAFRSAQTKAEPR